MDAVTETKPSNLEGFLREFDGQWLKPRVLSDYLGAAVDYLRALPNLTDALNPLVAQGIAGIVERLDHVGFCLDPVAPQHIEGVLTAAGFKSHSWWSSCWSSRRMIVVGHGDDGDVEIALDGEHKDPPHIAWRLRHRAELMDVGAMLEGTKFSEPDHMKNKIAFNREQCVMFRYFDGEIGGHRLRLEFCL